MGQKSEIVLTKRLCDTAECTGAKYVDIWDAHVAGFGLRVMSTGVKSFIVRYRADGGGRTAARRLMTIGRYGSLTVEQARKKAKAVLGAVAGGDDPAAKRTAKRSEMLLSALREKYEKEGCVVSRGKRIGHALNPLTKKLTLARMDHHIIPLLGHKRISDIRAGEVEQMVREIAAGKTAKREKVGPRRLIVVKGGEGAARKAVKDLSILLNFARRLELIDKNPVEIAAVRKTDNQRERFLSIEELGRLGTAFDQLEREGANMKAIQICRLWALTGCRRNEIAGLKWSEVDLERGFLLLEATKTGRSQRPLGRAAVEVLRGVSPEPGSDYVFPDSDLKGTFFQGTKKIWPDVKRLSGLPDVTPHTLRHTMGSTSVSAGQALAMTGAILGHRNPRSTAIYAHVDMAPAKRAADKASDRIASAMARRSPGRAKAHLAVAAAPTPENRERDGLPTPAND